MQHDQSHAQQHALVDALHNFVIDAVVGDVLQQPGRLFLLVAKRERSDLVRRVLLRAELFFEQLGIVRQHAPRRLEDLARAATVLVQHDGPVNRVIALEPHEHVGVGARPREDRLLVVAHREEVAVRRGQALQQVVLDRVHVLELVHQEVVPARRDRVGDVAPHPQQLLGFGDEVVEVQHVAVREPGRVLPIHARVVGRERVILLLDAVPAESGQERSALFERHVQPTQDHLLVLLVRHPEAFL